MKKIMIVDDNYLSAEGIEKNIDWEALNAEIVHICYNGTSAIEAMKKESVDLDHLRYRDAGSGRNLHEPSGTQYQSYGKNYSDQRL